MIGKYICSITVSVDGNEDINNYNRVYPNGNGSFLRISNFIHYIKKWRMLNYNMKQLTQKLMRKRIYEI